ncbi:MAG: TolC family protein [Pseudomonadota bacterium]
MGSKPAMAFMGIALICTQVVRADIVAATSITLDEAIERTVRDNPALVASGFQLVAQQGRIVQAELRPNLALDLEVENLLGTGDFSALDRSETTLSLAWVLERGKREGRSAVAQAELTVLETEQLLARIDAAAGTARLYLDALELQALLTLAEESVARLEQLTEAISRRVEAGRSPRADLARSEVALAEQRLALDDLEHSLTVALHRLAAQWGETAPALREVQGDPASLPKLESFAVLSERVEASPRIARLLTERRVGEARLRLAEVRARPNWRARAGLRHLEGPDEQAFVVGVTVPFGRNRNQGRIAEARTALAATDATGAASRIQLETELFALHQELEHEVHIAETFREEILPRVESALAETETAYLTGRYSFLDLKSAQDESTAARSAAVVAAVNANRARIEIEHLIGLPIGSEGANNP